MLDMVSNSFGFHFFYLDRVTPRWVRKIEVGEGRTDRVTDLLSWLATTVDDDAPLVCVVDARRAECVPNWQAKALHASFGAGNTGGVAVSA